MKFYRSVDVPWRVKCRRIVAYVYSVFCFGSVNWSWSRASPNRIEGWETKAMRRVLRFKKIRKMRRGQIMAQGRARIVRQCWTKMKRPCLSEVMAESMWRAMGWVCDQRPNAVINLLKLGTKTGLVKEQDARTLKTRTDSQPLRCRV